MATKQLTYQYLDYCLKLAKRTNNAFLQDKLNRLLASGKTKQLCANTYYAEYIKLKAEKESIGSNYNATGLRYVALERAIVILNS